RGEALWQQLQEPQRDRVRELARNPLRLSLLCQIFHTNPDETLPSTKAGLYQQFVQYFYEWKEEQNSTTEAQRWQLNEALGKLAFAGLDNQQGLQQFRLPERSAREVMGHDWFELAERLGWLNIVDLHSGTDEKVYAFFHATFQEYFASLKIDSYLYFVQDSKRKYRVFTPHWKEVILFWLGVEDSKVSEHYKNILISSLYTFNQKIGSVFFYPRAICLASLGINEFPSCKITTEIIVSLTQLKLGFFNEDGQYISSQIYFTEELENDFNKAVEALSLGSHKKVLEDTLFQQLERIKTNANRIPIALDFISYIAKTHINIHSLFDETINLIREIGEEDILPSPSSISISAQCDTSVESTDLIYIGFWGFIFSKLLPTLTQINKTREHRLFVKIIKNVMPEIISRELRLFIELYLYRIVEETSQSTELADYFIQSSNPLEYLLFLRTSMLMGLNLSSELDTLLLYFRNIDDFQDDFKEQVAIVISHFYLEPTVNVAVRDFLDRKTVPLDMFSLELIHRICQLEDFLLEEDKLFSSLKIANDAERRKIAHIMGRFNLKNSKFIEYFEDLLSQSSFSQVSEILDILAIDPFHKQALDIMWEEFLVIISLQSYQTSNNTNWDINILNEQSVLLATFLISGGRYQLKATTLLMSFFRSPTSIIDGQDGEFKFSVMYRCYEALEKFSREMGYEIFCQVWNNSSVLNNITGNTNYPKEIITCELENKLFEIISIKSESGQHHVLNITVRVSDNQSENTIAKRLWTRIYSQAFPDRKNRPKVEDLGDLEQELLSLQDELQVQKLAIIFHDCEPQPNLVSLLNQLTDFLHIGWITDQPVSFRSFHPDPIDTLASRIQSWLDEL
ncbi:MAG: hypothetical protein VKJ64_18955, partial [Leptolyngbyaceae bacterium]|nr:hypothetical protein [Leptolyngbyaceae bacterium]